MESFDEPAWVVGLTGVEPAGVLLVRAPLLDTLAARRAGAQARAGVHPWLCQNCDASACAHCGVPLVPVMASDLLEDDGRIVHQTTLPIGQRCPTNSCLQT